MVTRKKWITLYKLNWNEGVQNLYFGTYFGRCNTQSRHNFGLWCGHKIYTDWTQSMHNVILESLMGCLFLPTENLEFRCRTANYRRSIWTGWIGSFFVLASNNIWKIALKKMCRLIQHMITYWEMNKNYRRYTDRAFIETQAKLRLQTWSFGVSERFLFHTLHSQRLARTIRVNMSVEKGQ